MEQTLLITGGRLLDQSQGLLGEPGELLLSQGKIVKIAPFIPREPKMTVHTLHGEYVAPGFIDTHTHVYTATSLGIHADDAGVYHGVTSVLDAGSSGPVTMADFIDRDISTSSTRIFSAMHFAKIGLVAPPEADHPDKYDLNMAEEAIRRYCDHIVAIKARASRSAVGEQGMIALRAAKELSHRTGLPLLVHIGNPPPDILDVLALMAAGDIITHAYHGKVFGLMENGKMRPETLAARKRGVLFDVGHGSESFNFNTAKAAFSQGFPPDVISTDLHSRNLQGPVYSLARTLDKLLALGISLEDCVEKVTAAPAKAYGLDRRGLGRLKEGFIGDLTVFDLWEGENTYMDSDGNSLTGTKRFHMVRTFLSGKIAECREDA